MQNIIQHHPKLHPMSSKTSSNIIQNIIQRHPKHHPTSSKTSSNVIQNIIQHHPKLHPTSSKTLSNVIQNVIGHPKRLQRQYPFLFCSGVTTAPEILHTLSYTFIHFVYTFGYTFIHYQIYFIHFYTLPYNDSDCYAGTLMVTAGFPGPRKIAILDEFLTLIHQQ